MSAVLGSSHPDQRIGNWMQTQSGRAYWPTDPRIEDIDIVDIAGALSRICRFGGHLKDCYDHYSVAEHCIHVSRLVPREHALAGLLHDATEAYTGDVVRPLKQELTGYKRIEYRNWLLIARKFGLAEELPECVHHADVAMLFAEHEVLLEPSPLPGWGMGLVTPIVASRGMIGPLSRRRAKWQFLERFNELCPEQAVEIS